MLFKYDQHIRKQYYIPVKFNFSNFAVVKGHVVYNVIFLLVLIDKL